MSGGDADDPPAQHPPFPGRRPADPGPDRLGSPLPMRSYLDLFGNRVTASKFRPGSSRSPTASSFRTRASRKIEVGDIDESRVECSVSKCVFMKSFGDMKANTARTSTRDSRVQLQGHQIFRGRDARLERIT